jgi:hypothetical protein
MRSKRRPRLAASLAFGSLLALVACSSVLGVDDYKDSTSELCDLLRACYGYPACERHVGQSLDGAAPQQRTAWLVALSDQACLLQCTSARLCLDIPPVCTDEHESCNRKEDCCQFLEGNADCASRPVAGGGEQKICCRTDGAECTDNEQCCTGYCDPRTGTCGGVNCRKPDEKCATDYQCCTGLCVEHVCKKGICTALGDACSGDDRCCDGATCQPNGRCGYDPQCRQESQPCAVGSTDPAQTCCTDLDCVALPGDTTGLGVCGAGCLPDNSTCADGSECCGLFCDPYLKRCGPQCTKAYDPEPCNAGYDCCSGNCVNGACECADDVCVHPEDCCSGACVNGLCTATCQPTSCHNACMPGAPMDATCPDPTGGTCVSDVCAIDSYCCCTEWDDLCLSEVVAACGDQVCQ